MNKANIYAQDMRQWTALHYAAYNGYGKVCNLVLKWDADHEKLRDMKNSQNKKAIHICKNPETKLGFKSKCFDLFSKFCRYLEGMPRWRP